MSDHALMLTLPGASLSIEHRVTDVTAAASGAVLASEWLVGRKLGFYAMSDVYDSLVTEHRRQVTDGSLNPFASALPPRIR